LLGVQFSLIGGAYRCIGRYPAHTFIVNLSKLVELFVGILIVFLGYGPVVLAAVYVIIRICFLAFMIINVRRLNTWISISVKKVDFEPVRGILNPSLSSAGYSLGNIFVNQGVILTIGHFLGGSAVASYSVMRTLTRVLLKFVGILNSNYMPEMSAAFGAKDMELFRDLNRQLSKYTFWMIVVAVVSLGFLGESVLTLWTLDRVELDELVFMFVILEAATYFIGYTGSVPIVAINEHATFVIVYVVFAILGLFMSWMMLPLLGLVAVPVSFVLGNLVVGGFVVASVMKISDDRFFSYIANVIFLKNSYVR